MSSHPSIRRKENHVTVLEASSLAGRWEVDPVHSSVGFAVRHLGVSMFRASFHDLDARLIGDESGFRLEGAARVESISITDPQEFREHVVRGGEFFDGDKHPEITFRSDEVRLADDGNSVVSGLLTVKGISHPIVANGTYQRPVADPFGSTRAALELMAAIDRRDWNMSWQMPLPQGGDALAWGVELRAYLELVKQE
jgi:polyisoprenoid-binding protein YceI